MGLFVDPYAQAFVSAVPPIFESGPTVYDDPALAELVAAFEHAMDNGDSRRCGVCIPESAGMRALGGART